MGGVEIGSLDSMEPTLRYHFDYFEQLTISHYLGKGHSLVGSLTGVVASGGGVLIVRLIKKSRYMLEHPFPKRDVESGTTLTKK